AAGCFRSSPLSTFPSRAIEVWMSKPSAPERKADSCELGGTANVFVRSREDRKQTTVVRLARRGDRRRLAVLLEHEPAAHQAEVRTEQSAGGHGRIVHRHNRRIDRSGKSRGDSAERIVFRPPARGHSIGAELHPHRDVRLVEWPDL